MPPQMPPTHAAVAASSVESWPWLDVLGSVVEVDSVSADSAVSAVRGLVADGGSMIELPELAGATSVGVVGEAVIVTVDAGADPSGRR